MNFPHGEIVSVLTTVTTTDDDGNSTTETAEVSWGPCGIAPRYASESVDPHSPAVVVGKTIYGPATFADGTIPAELNADDQLLIGGDLYAVDGEAGDWQSPFTGWHPGLEVAVKRAGAV
ncbi:MAG TPA: hypothetical protein VJ782_01520 [Aeromicrobium sp.]|nr:hypothetical protein [Aeromicrobium sp.]